MRQRSHTRVCGLLALYSLRERALCGPQGGQPENAS